MQTRGAVEGSDSQERQCRATPCMSPARLIEVAEELCSTFNEAQVTLDAHLDESLRVLNVVDISDATFLRQAVYGTDRYHALIKAALAALYHFCGGVVLRKDRTTYALFTYLTVIRLVDLGISNFSMLVSSQPAQKMLPFLKFLFDPQHVKEDLAEEWLKTYDRQFVNECTDRLLSNRDALQPLFESLEHQLYLSAKAAEAAKDGPGFTVTLAGKHTKPEPFNLTPQKPRPLPAPEEDVPLESCPPAKPAPPRVEGPTKEQAAIDEAKSRNRAAIRAKYPDLGKGPPVLRSDQRPGTKKVEELRTQLESEAAAAAAPVPARRPVPPPPTAEVRVNAAAILREDAVLRRRQRGEAAALRRYEAELRDEADHAAWRARVKAEDERARLERLNDRREDAKQSRAAAMAAADAQLAQRQQQTRARRATAAAEAAAAARETAAAAAANAAKSAQVREERSRASCAQARIAQRNAAQAAEQREAARKAAARAAEVAVADRKTREDLVRRIRAVERVPMPKGKTFNPTEAGGHGLLEEMSVQELKARLEFVEMQRKEEVAATRADIMRKKQERVATLTRKAAYLRHVRELSAAQAAARRKAAAEAQTAAAAAALKEREDRVVQVAEKLMDKRRVQAEERAAQATEAKRVAFMQQQHAAGSAEVEQKRFLSLREGAQREARTRQQSSLEESNVREQTRRAERSAELRHARQKLRNKREFVRQYDARLDSLRREHEQAHLKDTERKQAMAAQQKAHEGVQAAKRAAAAYTPGASATTDMQQRLRQLAAGMDAA